MDGTDREIQRVWPKLNKDSYETEFVIETVTELYGAPPGPEKTAARTCRRASCRRARTCERPQTCTEAAMVDHREFMEIAAEMAAKEGVPNPFAPPKS
jgi:hypothetical protein